jgi:hypothetical protein
MNTKTKTRALLVTMMLATAIAGCELIVDFDRTKIDGGGIDGSTTDVATDTQTMDVQPPKDSGPDVKDTGTPDVQDSGADVQDSGDPDADQ